LTGIGYDYALSKRTTAYFRSESIDDKAGMATARATIDVAGQTKIQRTAIGVRHTF
jgi:predicted porin